MAVLAPAPIPVPVMQPQGTQATTHRRPFIPSLFQCSPREILLSDETQARLASSLWVGAKRQSCFPPAKGTTGAPPDPKHVEQQEAMPTERAGAEALSATAWKVVTPPLRRLLGLWTCENYNRGTEGGSPRLN